MFNENTRVIHYEDLPLGNKRNFLVNSKIGFVLIQANQML